MEPAWSLLLHEALTRWFHSKFSRLLGLHGARILLFIKLEYGHKPTIFF